MKRLISPDDVKAAFFTQVKKKRGLGCWEWTARKNKDGYGVIYYDGKMNLSHRVSWRVLVSEIPEGICVLHKCDNRQCVKPDHLFLGTRQDNNNDKIAKGRQRSPTGENNASAKLNKKWVREIRSSNLSRVQLAKKYGVAYTTIRRVLIGMRWNEE